MRVRKNPTVYVKQEKERLKKKQSAINDLMLEWLAEDEPRAEAEDSVMSNDFQPEELPKLTLKLLAARDNAMDNYQEGNKDVHPMKSSKAKMDSDLDSEESFDATKMLYDRRAFVELRSSSSSGSQDQEALAQKYIAENREEHKKMNLREREFHKTPSVTFEQIGQVLLAKKGTMASYKHLVDLEQLVEEGEIVTDGAEKAGHKAELARLTKEYLAKVQQLSGESLSRELMFGADGKQSPAQEPTTVTNTALSMALDLAAATNKTLDIEDLLGTTDDPRESLKGNKLPVDQRIKRIRNTRPSQPVRRNAEQHTQREPSQSRPSQYRNQMVRNTAPYFRATAESGFTQRPITENDNATQDYASIVQPRTPQFSETPQQSQGGMQTRESQFVPFQYQPFGYNPFQFFQPPSQRTSQVSNASNISQPQMQMPQM